MTLRDPDGHEEQRDEHPQHASQESNGSPRDPRLDAPTKEEVGDVAHVGINPSLGFGCHVEAGPASAEAFVGVEADAGVSSNGQVDTSAFAGAKVSASVGGEKVEAKAGAELNDHGVKIVKEATSSVEKNKDIKVGAKCTLGGVSVKSEVNLSKAATVAMKAAKAAMDTIGAFLDRVAPKSDGEKSPGSGPPRDFVPRPDTPDLRP